MSIAQTFSTSSITSILGPGLSLALAYFMGEQTKATAFDNGTGEETREIGLEIDGFEITLNGQINDNNAIRFGLASVDATKSKGSGEAK